ncbi:MAG: hypothetical protein AB7P94_16790 [Steroidobacteraceae bacterium]
MFGSDHIALQISPKAWAVRTLERVKAGEPVSRRVIDLALQFSGDMPRPIEGRLHELEPFQAADAARSRSA